MINIAEKLKGCPQGTKLYSPMCGEVELVRIDMGHHKFPIIVRVLDNKAPYSNETFTAEGKWCNTEQSECLLFPSKDNRDWNKFDYRIKPKCRPFKNAEECWQEMLKHKPFGWILDRYGEIYNIVKVRASSITICLAVGFEFYNYEEASEFTFIDGTPFGIKE